jgi:hypothetical protein
MQNDYGTNWNKESEDDWKGQQYYPPRALPEVKKNP